MLYRILKRMIARGCTVGMVEKLAVFLEAGKLTREEYVTLREMIAASEA